MTSRVKAREHGSGWGDAPALHLAQLQKAVSIGYVVLLAVSAVIVLAAEPELIRFAPITAAELTEILLPLMLVSLFLARAVEVLVTAWRQGARDQIELAIESLTESGGSTSELRHELTAHRDGTRCVALLASMVTGVLLASLGLRSLELLVDADMLAALPAWQQTGFSAFDVVVTGALIAGGADGIHKVVATFTGFLDESSRRVRARRN